VRIEIPDLAECATARDFVQRLIDVNRARNGALSIRWFGQRLDWPASYINDVLADRKQLTLQRALELAKAFDLDMIQTEQLVLLCLASSREAPIAHHFRTELDRRFSKKETEAVSSLGILGTVEALHVFALLGWTLKRLPTRKIIEALYTLPDLDPVRVDAIIVALEREKLITIDANGAVTVEAKRREFMLGPQAVADRQRLTLGLIDSLRSYIESPRRQSPGKFTFKLATIHPKYADLLEARVQQLSAWISEIEFRPDKPDAEREGNRLYLMTNFFVPVADPEPAGR
jgi:hypothetical protein